MNSLVSNVSVMPLTIRMSTNVTIARAMDRFNNRKNVFERKHALAENARRVDRLALQFRFAVILSSNPPPFFDTGMFYCTGSTKRR